jgi:hypothetical protein
MMCSNSTAAGVARNIVRERILVGSASCGYTSTHWAPGESVDVIAARAPDLYALKAVEHT